jgi:diguanylate cyclase (GGDEF)-like protein
MARHERLHRVVEVLHHPRAPVWQLALGQALLLVAGTLVAATIWSLHATRAALVVLGAVSIVMLALVAFASRLPWSGPESRIPLLFPVSVLAGLAAVGFADGGAATAYTGLIELCFVYVGLTQPSGTSVLMMPVAVGCWMADQLTWSPVVAIRLTLSVMVWLGVGELLSYRSERATEARLELAAEAHTDSLTGLINRRALDARLGNAREGDTIVMCDLDHFKELNDHHGHAAGDRALAGFGLLLQAALRGADAAGRYGGDEFVILLADTSPEAALDVLARIRARWCSIQPDLTFTTGVAPVEGVTQIEAALEAADAALYAAKQGGRNSDRISYQPLAPDLHPGVPERA